MGNGNFHRRKGATLKDVFLGDPKVVQLVDKLHEEKKPHQVTDPAEVTQLCLQTLEGNFGIYEMFDAKWIVKKHPHADYSIIEFCGGLLTCPVRNEIRIGYFIPVTKLLPNPEKMCFKDENEAIFITFLLSQDEMKIAKMVFFQNQKRKNQEEAVRAAALEDEKRKEVLAKIRAQALTKPQPLQLTKLADILTANYATYNHASGVTLFVCRGFREGIVIRAKNANENHVLHEQELQNISVMQEHLLSSEDDKEVVGKALLARQLRIWLRKELQKEGALPICERTFGNEETPHEEGPYLGKVVDYAESAVA